MHNQTYTNVIKVHFKRYNKAGWSTVRKLRVTRTALIAGWAGTLFAGIWHDIVR